HEDPAAVSKGARLVAADGGAADRERAEVAQRDAAAMAPGDVAADDAVDDRDHAVAADAAAENPRRRAVVDDRDVAEVQRSRRTARRARAVANRAAAAA